MDLLPTALSAMDFYCQFIVYKLVPSKDRIGKMEKMPIHPETGQPINAHDPNNWMWSSNAINISKVLGIEYGVGFVFSGKDPFWFLDIDDCYVNNQWTPIALELMAVFNGCAIEISQSLKGLHIFGSGLIPEHSCTNGLLSLEFYDKLRFVALTGINAIGDCATIITSEMLLAINKYFPIGNTQYLKSDWTETPCAEWVGPNTDNDLIQRALNSKSTQSIFSSKASFSDLWNNNQDILAITYPSPDDIYNRSHADAALAMHLSFWTGRNCERIRKLMLQSALKRDKWERGDIDTTTPFGTDYLPFTIINACSQQTNVCQDTPMEINTRNLMEPRIRTGNSFVGLDQQLKLFKDCVYVLDEHRIFIGEHGILVKPDQFNAWFDGYTFQVDAANAGKPVKKAFEAFTGSQLMEFPRAIGTCFKPAEPPAQILAATQLLNVFIPPVVIAQSGDPTPFIQHISKILPDPKDQLILISFMAACVQYPGVKFKWAPFIQGVDGNGKSILISIMEYSIGDRYCTTVEAKKLNGQFNGFMYRKMFVGVHETFLQEGNYDAIETLKILLDSEKLEIELKFANATKVEVCCNFLFCSNHRDGIKKTTNDRRFAPLYCAQQQSEDLIRDGLTPQYFNGFVGWLKQREGHAITTHFLQNFEIPDDILLSLKTRAPITSSTTAAINYGLGGLEQEILEYTEEGRPGFKNGWVSSMAIKNILGTRRISPNRIKDILHVLGYVYHPGLTDGRTNNPVTPDNGRPRLFIKRGHPDFGQSKASEIEKSYTRAQT